MSDAEDLTEAELNLATGTLAFEGLQDMRSVDHERAILLVDALVRKDDKAFNTTLGAVLRDNTGVNHIDAYVGVVVRLAGLLADQYLDGLDPQTVSNMLRSNLKASLRDSQ
jgi:hypothetical protein